MAWNGRHCPTTTRPCDRQIPPWWALGLCVKECRQGDCDVRRHINVLELTVGMFAVQVFAKDRKNVPVHLRMDNTSTLTYVCDQDGGTWSIRLTAVTRQIWDWWAFRGRSPSQHHIYQSCHWLRIQRSANVSRVETTLWGNQCSTGTIASNEAESSAGLLHELEIWLRGNGQSLKIQFTAVLTKCLIKH